MIRESIKADGSFWSMAETGEGYEVVFWGEALEVCSMVEELARELKRRALGLDE